MKRYRLIAFLIILVFYSSSNQLLFAQEETEQIRYYQMEPLDDSLVHQYSKGSIY